MRIHTQNIPTFSSYKDAAEYEASIKPIRGTDIKPLVRHQRRKTHLSILKAGSKNIVFRLYGTDVVWFCPGDKVEVSLGLWNTSSTRGFIGAVLGTACFAHNATPYIGAIADVDGEPIEGYFPLHNRGQGYTSTLKFIDGELHYLNPLFPKAIRVDRKQAKNCYALYSEFIAYAHGLAKIYEHDWDAISKKDCGRSGYLSGAMLSEVSNEKEPTPAVMQDAAIAVFNKIEHRNWTGTPLSSAAYAMALNPNKVRPAIYKLIRQLHPETERVVEIKTGVVV